MISITEFIMLLIKDILGGVNKLGTGDSVLLKTPQTYNAGIYNGTMNIMENAVIPVSYIVLGLLFMLELYNITIRTEGMNHFGFEIVFRAMFKIVLIKMLVDSTPLVMGAIYDISTEIIGKMGNVFASSGGNLAANISAIEDKVDKLGVLTKTMTAVQVLLVWFVYKFSTIVIQIIMVGRMFEIYVHLGIAPLPLATFPNAEMSSTGKNFLKSFAAVSLQGVLIFFVLGMYNVLVSNMGSSNSEDLTVVLFESMFYSLVLVVSLFMTGKWSKSITNAM